MSTKTQLDSFADAVATATKKAANLVFTMIDEGNTMNEEFNTRYSQYTQLSLLLGEIYEEQHMLMMEEMADLKF